MMRRLLLLIFLCLPVFATVSMNTVWEVRPTVGTDTNGGGFVAGASGTDMSVFNNKNATSCTNCQSATVNISTTDAVTAGTTTVTSASMNCSSALVGNLINISGGTGSIVSAWYEVKTVTLGTPPACSFTVDRSTGLTIGTGATMNIGGALATIGVANTNGLAGNKIFVKSPGSAVSVAATITLSLSGSPANNQTYSRLIGYTTTRGDGSTVTNRPTLQASASSVNILSVTGNGWSIENFIIDCNSQATCRGISNASSSYMISYNNKITNFTVYGILTGANSLLYFNEVTGGTSCTNAIAGSSQTMAARNYIHDNACTALNISGGSVAAYNLVTNATGSTSDGITFTLNPIIVNNTIDSPGRHGIGGSNNGGIAALIQNNVVSNAGVTAGTAYGIFLTGNGGSQGFPAFPTYDGNCFFNNKTANRHFMDDTTTNPVNNVAPYTNVIDVTASTTPYTTAGSDYTLNNTAGGGAVCRGAGVPGSFLGISQTGTLDMGALQSAAAAAAGASYAYVQ